MFEHNTSEISASSVSLVLQITAASDSLQTYRQMILIAVVIVQILDDSRVTVPDSGSYASTGRDDDHFPLLWLGCLTNTSAMSPTATDISRQTREQKMSIICWLILVLQPVSPEPSLVQVQ